MPGYRWNEREDAHLAEHYRAISARRLSELLPGRTEKAIRRHAEELNLKKCHERLREMGRENIDRRWRPEVFKTPEPPTQ